MPKLYYTPTSCSAASFITAWTGQVSLECEQVNIQSHTTSSGVDFYTINPKGNVPCIVFEDGMILNENSSCLQWIADQISSMNFRVCPPSGTTARYEVQNCLAYISSELQAAFVPLFTQHPEQLKQFFIQRANTKLAYLEKTLIGDKTFLIEGWGAVRDKPTIADFYLYMVLTWCPTLGLDLTSYPKCKAFMERIGSIQQVKEAFIRMKANPSTILATQPTGTVGEKIKDVFSKIGERLTGMTTGTETSENLENQQPANVSGPTPSSTASLEKHRQLPMPDTSYNIGRSDNKIDPGSVGPVPESDRVK
jgi:glutathione S-transferase